ncbi:hypothetical protein [uncultured Methanoregula sp.]|uniref:hypothetical protein n=1 Tax=uncultured Methanoregula sp. TaxID=1005933 RepID=UPI002AAA935F|nr:hypothetical protein [uncultured Methanoregula sp.]
MEKGCNFFILLLLLSGFIASTGCTSLQSPEDKPAITPAAPAPANITIKIMATNATTAVTTKTTPATKKNITTATPTAQPDPMDVSQVRFVRYSDNDFSLEYPSAWTVTNSTYAANSCVSSAVKRCYQKEIKTIGPFDFNDDSRLKKISRIITFTSADHRQKVVAFTSDFLDNTNGNYVLNPSIEWCKDLVTANFVDVPGSAVGDYQYSQSGSTMTSVYTVTMPKGSAAYPLAYAMKNFVTIHHRYYFAFISDTDNLEKYHNLRDRIFSSITPE